MSRMLVSIGINIVDGPWGGGNQFAQALTQFLRSKGVEVRFDLDHHNIDLIVLFDPRRSSQSASFQTEHIFRYLQGKPDTLVVHRVNECDERKGSKGVNRSIALGNYCADHTVFVSEWLKNLYNNKGILPCRSQSVILNGADASVFNQVGKQRWNGLSPLKVVTHHWGTHWNKGFEYYSLLDDLIGRELKGKVEFTYIGNLPKGYTLYNSRYVSPLHGSGLADMLREHDVYLTASQNEPGSNHQNEGAMCGLPVLYLDSGPMAEYLSGYGVSFTRRNFVDSLFTLLENYEHYCDELIKYPNTASKTCVEYYNLFVELLGRKDMYINKRSRFKKPFWVIKDKFMTYDTLVKKYYAQLF